MEPGAFALGVDIGTSGVRTAVVDTSGAMVSSARVEHSARSGEDANAWWDAVGRAIRAQVTALEGFGLDAKHIACVAVDGTSGSMVLVDASLQPVTPALMYNSSGFEAEAETISQFAEPTSITRGTSSALGRMLRLQNLDGDGKAANLLHQADFILAKLAGRSLGSDDNNALKLGWDPESRTWPSWFAAAGVRLDVLPEVHVVGEVVGQIDAHVAEAFGLSADLQLHAGTTDSIAAFLASGAREVGDAVTSLGTTLAIKLLSDTRVDDPARGIYSHRLGSRWLAGGASNTGGGVLASFFSGDHLKDLSEQIDPDVPSGLEYYPLIKPGERFPINDPRLPPRLEPRPDNDALFLHGMLEGIARIEALGYAELQALGSPVPKRIFTAGGGAKNPIWSTIRAKMLPAPLVPSDEAEACVGVARLCLG